jgi:hypothetical protein
MRADMHKVVVERPRYGSRRTNRKWGQRLSFVPDADYDDQLKFVSSSRRRQYGPDCKWFSDVLGPLKGFLHRNVGRPWDKVYSELRNGLDVRKVTGRHIFDHLKLMVETDCSIGVDRKVYSGDGRYSVDGFYVHPKNGLLCFVPTQSARQRKKERLLQQDIDEVRLDRCHSYKRIDDLWYYVAYEFVEVARGTTRSCWDVVDRGNVTLSWGRCRVAVSKRQCNSDEVRWIRERIAAWEKEVRRM